MIQELDSIRTAVKEIDRRLASNSSHAAVHISSGGAVAVLVGIVAVVCLIAASALAFVSWQQASVTERQTAELRARVEMAEAKLILLEGRQRRSEK
jgi:cytochrome c-type biogenesis protein CcmH/NrfG